MTISSSSSRKSNAVPFAAFAPVLRAEDAPLGPSFVINFKRGSVNKSSSGVFALRVPSSTTIISEKSPAPASADSTARLTRRARLWGGIIIEIVGFYK